MFCMRTCFKSNIRAQFWCVYVQGGFFLAPETQDESYFLHQTSANSVAKEYTKNNQPEPSQGIQYVKKSPYPIVFSIDGPWNKFHNP